MLYAGDSQSLRGRESLHPCPDHDMVILLRVEESQCATVEAHALLTQESKHIPFPFMPDYHEVTLSGEPGARSP